VKRLQVVLREAVLEPHEFDCPAHHYLCTCGHDEKLNKLLRQAANRIEELEEKDM